MTRVDDTMSLNSIHLQGVGRVAAVPLSEVKIGDTLVWNFGATSRVVALRYVTSKTIELTTECDLPYGKGTDTDVRRKRASTLICKR